jgi:hypothetical protein
MGGSTQNADFPTASPNIQRVQLEMLIVNVLSFKYVLSMKHLSSGLQWMAVCDGVDLYPYKLEQKGAVKDILG